MLDMILLIEINIIIMIYHKTKHQYCSTVHNVILKRKKHILRVKPNEYKKIFNPNLDMYIRFVI